MCGFYCIALIEFILAGKSWLDHTNLFSPNSKYFKGISILRASMSSLEFRMNKIDETRNYLLEKIKHNDLMSEKYKKTCKNLNYLERLLILVSTITNCLSISAFTSLACVA